MSALDFGYAGTSLEPTWTTAQAAEFLGLAKKTVLNLCSKGEIPFRKNGRINGYLPSELAQFRASRLGLNEGEGQL